MAKGKNTDEWFKKLRKDIQDSMNRARLTEIGKKAVDLIVKRTRLGYSVTEDGANKEPLASLSEKYIEKRSKMRSGDRKAGRKKRGAEGIWNLSDRTTPSKSNLTLTGQMLDSMQVLNVIMGTIRAVEIGAKGIRRDGLDNADVQKWVEAGEHKNGKTVPRPFNHVSALEFKQLFRLWRKMFGDLRKRFG